MSISIAVPESLVNTDSSVARTYKIIRIHDGEATVIEGSFDDQEKLFNFETDVFSTYALVYSDEKAGQDADTSDSGSGDTDTSGSGGGNTVVLGPGKGNKQAPTQIQQPVSPKTGEETGGTYTWLVFAALSGIGMAFFMRKKRSVR